MCYMILLTIRNQRFCDLVRFNNCKKKITFDIRTILYPTCFFTFLLRSLLFSRARGTEESLHRGLTSDKTRITKSLASARWRGSHPPENFNMAGIFFLKRIQQNLFVHVLHVTLNFVEIFLFSSLPMETGYLDMCDSLFWPFR